MRLNTMEIPRNRFSMTGHEKGRGPDKALGLIRERVYCCAARAVFTQLSNSGWCFDPAINVAVNVGFGSMAFMHHCILGVDVGDRQLHDAKQSGGGRIFSARALLATMCMVFTGKP